MPSKQKSCNSLSRTISHTATVALALVIILALTVTLTQSAQGQTFTVIHDFTGGGDGARPFAGVTIDASGHLYGTNTEGAVFTMRRQGPDWIFTPLSETGSFGGVIRDAGGSLYGTTAGYCGTVFKLTPSPTAPVSLNAPWTKSVLHRFTGGNDGCWPLDTLVFDQAGNLYGTSSLGGSGDGVSLSGVVFKLTPSNEGWTETVLYTFTGGNDGNSPIAGVVFDKAGKLYGTTSTGGPYNCGAVFQLTRSGSGWRATVLHTFMGNGDGCNPIAGVTLDEVGNVYGATSRGDDGHTAGGTVFELSPQGGGWKYSLIWTFYHGGSGFCNIASAGPAGTLTLDNSGNLYGTTQEDGAYGQGNVFKLARSNGAWTYTSLHDFAGIDGWGSCGAVAFDASGHMYGTANFGGSNFDGVVWEITP